MIAVNEFKLSCLPVSFFASLSAGTMKLDEWFDMAAGIGLRYADLSSMHISVHTPVNLYNVQKSMEKAGVGLCMVCTYPDFSHPDAVQRERELVYLRNDIAAASQLGAKFVRILAGQKHEKTPVKDGINWVVEGFLKAETLAEKLGITLVFENHSKPGAWHLSDFSHPANIFLEIANRLRNTGIGINFDTINTVLDHSDPLAVLKEVISMVRTVHIADSSETDQLIPCVIGTGKAPVREILSILHAAGFDGYYCVEEASGTGRPGVEAAVDFMRSLLTDMRG
jgi:sugar phosphate isomerase/epimerase